MMFSELVQSVLGDRGVKSLLVALLALLLLLAAAAADIAHYYPLLPERIAIHFIWSGEGNQFENKADWVSESLRWGWFPLLVILGAGLLSSLLILFLPQFVRLPNKEYWTTPEHRTEAAALVMGFHLWFSVILLAFILTMMHEFFVANLSAPPRISNVVTLLQLVGLLSAIVVLFVVFLRQLYFPSVGPASRPWPGRRGRKS